MALPWLEAMTPAFASSIAHQPPRRFVAVTLALGLHGPNLNPREPGRNYTPSLYLSEVKDLLGDMTIVTGSLTSRCKWRTPSGRAVFLQPPLIRVMPPSGTLFPWISIWRNTRATTRDSRHLVLDINGTTSASYTESGSMIPAEESPSAVFNQLFVADTPEEKARQVERLKQGRSIMDVVAADVKRVEKKVEFGGPSEDGPILHFGPKFGKAPG